MANILIVEDEELINELIARNLQTVGHVCTQVYDGFAALKQLQEENFDLLILDVMLPGMSGFELMEHLSEVPVIFLTAKGNVMDKVKGLSLGAEDYMVKPFEMLELIARVDVILRRSKKQTCIFELDGVCVDFGNMTVTKGEEPVELTPREFQLLEVLISNRNIAMSRDKLLDLAWGVDFYGDNRTVDVHIQRLRRKLGWTDRIRTVYKLGYRLETRS